MPSYNEMKCKPSANCACAVSLIDGLGFICLYSWYPASSSRRVWHGLATVVDSMRESIHALRCDFLCLQDTQSERTRWRYACANLHISSLTCFSRHNFRTQHFYYFKNKASATLNPLVSLFGRLVARSGRKRGNRQTDGRKEGRTDGMTI